ncbi:hypothetical protein [Desulfovibrio sp. ZJ200]|uniref:hypothetical protein n=1 Tax=Desulfovibrio sp. ZJ200 TaxID=2709792 RepID=UPI0013EBEF5B|nr:hypothetical protein [Desulfovibrio sp. ZJ200]
MPCKVEHFHFENALLTRKRQPPQRSVHSGENRVFRLNVTFDFHKKSKVICSSPQGRTDSDSIAIDSNKNHALRRSDLHTENFMCEMAAEPLRHVTIQRLS